MLTLDAYDRVWERERKVHKYLKQTNVIDCRQILTLQCWIAFVYIIVVQLEQSTVLSSPSINNTQVISACVTLSAGRINRNPEIVWSLCKVVILYFALCCWFIANNVVLILHCLFNWWNWLKLLIGIHFCQRSWGFLWSNWTDWVTVGDFEFDTLAYREMTYTVLVGTFHQLTAYRDTMDMAPSHFSNRGLSGSRDLQNLWALNASSSATGHVNHFLFGCRVGYSIGAFGSNDHVTYDIT